MKTITIQGTEKQIETFRSSLSFNINEMPQKVEIRVYVIEAENTLMVDERIFSDLTDEEFMDLAEEEGRVYSLEGFKDAFNEEEINTAIDVIRFINVVI